MRKVEGVSFVVALALGALLVPAAPASAHVMTCESERGSAQGRATRFLDHLTKQYLEAVKPFDQVDEQDRFEGSLGACTAGAAPVTKRRVGRKVVTHRHPVLEYEYAVSQEGRGVVKQTVVYKVRLRWTGTQLSKIVLRPSGKVAVGGENEPGPVLPDIEPLI